MCEENKRKSFTFTWTLENISYCWQKRDEHIESPNFVINELQKSKYSLQLYPRGFYDKTDIECFLYRTGTGSGVRIDCEFALLAKDGSVLTSHTFKNRCEGAEALYLKEIRKVFDTERSIYLPEDKLTVRCRIWKSEGELTENVQCFARTRICIEKYSFLWKIKNLRYIPDQQCAYQIGSLLDNELLLTFHLLAKNTYTDEDLMTIQLVAEKGKIKHLVFCVTVLNDVSSASKTIRKEFTFCENKKPKLCILPFSKNDLISHANLWLPKDVLTLRCDCTISTGAILKEIVSINYECDRFQNSSLEESNTVSVSTHFLKENLKSLLHDSILSDIRLQTHSKTYFAHKSILSARSPVFKAMFENDMKEKINECVEIKDVDSDTVYQMLQYIYTAEIGDLQLVNAYNLYRAADKYEILALREECSTFLKSNLCPKNACEVLILADLHQDEKLKAATQDFIFNHDVINSAEWEQLMEFHVKLAANTMYLQIQGKTKRFPDKNLSSFSPVCGTNFTKKHDATPKNLSDSETTMTSASGLHISNSIIPFAGPVLETAGPYSKEKNKPSPTFSCSAKTPAEPYSLFGSKNEKTSAEPSSLLASDNEKKPIEQSISIHEQWNKTFAYLCSRPL